MADYCLVFRMSDNAGAQPWPAHSPVCVSMAVKYTPNDDMTGSTVQSMTDVQRLSMEGSGTFFEENHKNPAKSCKQLETHNNGVLNNVLCSLS